MKRKIFAANWKMYKTPAETREFFKKFTSFELQGEIIFFPSALCVEAAIESTRGSGIQIGIQNAYVKSEGAFTGENSVTTAKAMGCSTVLIGHSERRALFHENEILGEKVAFVQAQGLKAMFCIGETLDQREKNQTEAVLAEQLEKGLAKAKKENLILAYEPVWAIGTGKTATAAQAEEAHKFISQWLDKKGFSGVAILYGGSVKPENAAELMAQPHISGFLVGGASLDPESFRRCQVLNGYAEQQ
jgi:triosephosphate isomerase